MPDLDGIAATAEIVAASPDARIVILTTLEQDDYVVGALDAGASGFSAEPAPSGVLPLAWAQPVATQLLTCARARALPAPACGKHGP
jgi:DNA-binding NarL/FixJ family response regulator